MAQYQQPRKADGSPMTTSEANQTSEMSQPVLPFDAAALALFCFACPQMSQLVPA